MNINVYLEEPLANALNASVTHTGKPRNMIIREAVKEWIDHHQEQKWPPSIVRFKGIPRAPRFESTRNELLESSEDPLK